jgi:hypothetical protein
MGASPWNRLATLGAGGGRKSIDFTQGTGNCEAVDQGDRESGWFGPLAPDLHEGGKTFVERCSVLDQDRPPTT